MTCRFSFTTAIAFLICAATATQAAEVSPPKAPSDLQVTAVGINSFKLKWKDNSKNELGWEVKASLKGGTPQHYAWIRTKDTTSYTLFTNDLPGFGLVFQLAAYNGAVDAEVVSESTPSVSVTALSPERFDPPTGLTAEAIDDGRVRLSWTDNSTAENGYLLQFKKLSAKKWDDLGTVTADLKFRLNISGMLSDETYQFRVRAFRGTKLGGFSNVAETTTKKIRAPENLQAMPDAEGSFKFKWKDRSSVEAGFELQQKVDGGKFAWQWRFGTNTNETELLKNFPLDKDIQFRIAAFYLKGEERVYSGFSDVITVRSTALSKPSTLAMNSRTDSSITVKWKDNSVRENGFEVAYRKTGSTAYSSKYAAANITTLEITGLDAGQDYDVRVRAIDQGFFSSTFSPFCPFVKFRTKDGVGGNLNPLLSVGVPFIYQVNITNTALLTEVTVTGLPEGLTYNSVSRTITGTINRDITFALTVTAKFSDGTTSVRTINVRSTAPPAIVSSFDVRNLAVAATAVVSVVGKFSDPDTTSAARFETTSGQFDIIFFPTAAPKTVDNFIDYMDAGEYDDMFFHRAPQNFVVQGGGYKYKDVGGFSKVNKFATVENEPGISNLRGTVAMAKLSGLPDSASSEWFVNVKDNSANLDFQNSGFTVFGRVPTKGMIVVDKIRDLPVGNYNVTIGADTQFLEDLPVDAPSAPATLNPAKLVKVLSSGPAPILTYEVISSNPAIATATLSGTNITITGVTVGTVTIQVKAIDLDGNSVIQNFSVTVS